ESPAPVRCTATRRARVLERVRVATSGPSLSATAVRSPRLSHMTTRAPAYTLGREGGEDGSFRRQDSRFRGWISDDGSTEFPLQAGRYPLYVSRACPWAHRTLIARVLMGLQEAITVSYVDPYRDSRGWAFSGNGYDDPINGFEYLLQAYTATDPGYDLHA